MIIVLESNISYRLELDDDGMDKYGNFYEDVYEAVQSKDMEEAINAFRSDSCLPEEESWKIVVFDDDHNLLTEGSVSD